MHQPIHPLLHLSEHPARQCVNHAPTPLPHVTSGATTPLLLAFALARVDVVASPLHVVIPSYRQTWVSHGLVTFPLQLVEIGSVHAKICVLAEHLRMIRDLMTF